MKVSDFNFELPEELIAQHPTAVRDHAKLLVSSIDESLQDATVQDLPKFLAPNDILIFNDTKVLPARIVTKKSTGGKIEIFLLRRVSVSDGGLQATWEALLKGVKASSIGKLVETQEFLIQPIKQKEQVWTLSLQSKGERTVEDWIELVGETPLPPYIQRPNPDPSDVDRYQTMFAKAPGAVAAPTAGLHFTPRLLERLAAKGVAMAQLTLHVGWGTFAPVRVDQVEDHRVHKEWFVLPSAVVEAIGEAKSKGGRVVAVGTTVGRVLEYCSRSGELTAASGECDLYIYPGYKFRVIDLLLTNFHLPKSSLLFYVAAFHGTKRILNCYQHAIDHGYRFFSYGDATLLERA